MKTARDFLMKDILHIVLLAGCVGAMAQQPDKPEIYQSPLYNRIDHILLSPDGQMLVASDSTGYLLFWERDGSLRKILRAHLRPISAMACSADGSWLATADDNEIIVWNFQTGEKINSVQLNARVMGLAFSSDGASLFFGMQNGLYRIPSTPLGNPERLEDGSIACDLKKIEWRDNLVGTACADGSLRLFEWNGAAFKEIGRGKYDVSDLSQLLILDHQRVVIVNESGPVIWNFASGRFSMKGFPESFTAIGYGSNGFFYAGDRNGKVVSFKPSAGHETPDFIQPAKNTETKLETTLSGIPTTINDRTVRAQQPMEVKSSSLDIYVWDDEREDGDSISLYLNGEWLLQNYMITAEKKHLTVNLSPGKPNYLILYAHNLGKYPPNTAVIAFNDGSMEQELTLESDLKRCAAIHFVVK